MMVLVPKKQKSSSPLNLFGQIKNEKNDDGFGTEKTKIIKKIHENQTYFGRTKEHEKHIQRPENKHFP